MMFIISLVYLPIFSILSLLWLKYPIQSYYYGNYIKPHFYYFSDCLVFTCDECKEEA